MSCSQAGLRPSASTTTSRSAHVESIVRLSPDLCHVQYSKISQTVASARASSLRQFTVCSQELPTSACSRATSGCSARRFCSTIGMLTAAKIAVPDMQSHKRLWHLSRLRLSITSTTLLRMPPSAQAASLSATQQCVCRSAADDQELARFAAAAGPGIRRFHRMQRQ
jgi:hypothetical protein